MSEPRRNICVSLMVAAITTWLMSGSLQMAQADEPKGKQWAVLVAGSNTYQNYRHQADICHAYQILHKGGFNDENIIVFMYDDIANDPENPRPGILINRPKGPDVYKGVPKDYTGEHVNKRNFFAVLLGNRTALTGGSGKVVDSGPNDTIFVYYADHGAAGLVCMPDDDNVYADELMDVIKKKHEANGYKYMVLYVEACESGSMFQNILPNDINVYATTAANAEESSYAFYCPGTHPSPPHEYDTCLGDLYSISWMEDCDKHDMSNETLKQQYRIVHKRTLSYPDISSHVMQFGDKNISSFPVATFIGSANPTTSSLDNNHDDDNDDAHLNSTLVTQQDAHLLYLTRKVEKANDALKKQEAEEELAKMVSKRKHEDKSINIIGDLLFGHQKSSMILGYVRPQHQPLVDDWDCLRTLMKTYEMQCGKLSTYGKRYSRAFANMCNAGITENQLAAASYQACPIYI